MFRLIGRLAVLTSTFVTLIALGSPTVSAQEPPRSLLLATTTSVQDSGLLDHLLPVFMERTNIRVRAVAVGTGAALRMGAEGNADVLLTHAPSSEKKLLADGAIDRRVEIMQNYFVLAGPPADPADVRSAPSVTQALLRIRKSGAPFVSRGDDSGTHKREVALFRAAGLDPDEKFQGLTRTGSGMGLSLQIAGEKQAYILSDIGTFLAFHERIGLEVMSGNEASLRNVYAILHVNPERFPKVHADEATALEAFFARAETRAAIAKFGLERFGRRLFEPIPPP
jgi:tungstate transport system substrate-binding protein